MSATTTSLLSERYLHTPRELMGTERSGAHALKTQAFVQCAKRPSTPESECWTTCGARHVEPRSLTSQSYLWKQSRSTEKPTLLRSAPPAWTDEVLQLRQGVQQVMTARCVQVGSHGCDRPYTTSLARYRMDTWRIICAMRVTRLKRVRWKHPVSCGAGGDFGAVSSNCSLKCLVPFVAHSGFSRTSLVCEVEEKGGEEINGCLLSGWSADLSHGICHKDIGAYRAVAHWFESVVRMACRCVESWCVAPEVKYLRIVVT